MHYKRIVNTLPHEMNKPTSRLVHTSSLEDAVNHINQMDLSAIVKKITTKDPLICRHWSPTEAEIAVQYYKNFLYLNRQYLSTHPVLPPLLEVDEIWHHHILDTRQYIRDSNAIFGDYFHHYPYFGTRSRIDKINLDVAFEEVQKLYEMEFGNRMISIWSTSQ
jgi:hypothetical protein